MRRIRRKSPRDCDVSLTPNSGSAPIIPFLPGSSSSCCGYFRKAVGYEMWNADSGLLRQRRIWRKPQTWPRGTRSYLARAHGGVELRADMSESSRPRSDAGDEQGSLLGRASMPDDVPLHRSLPLSPLPRCLRMAPPCRAGGLWRTPTGHAPVFGQWQWRKDGRNQWRWRYHA